MDLFIALCLLLGIGVGFWYVWRTGREMIRTRPKVYRCACRKHEFTEPDGHYDDAAVYHGVELCQPHREMIVGQKKPPSR